MKKILFIACAVACIFVFDGSKNVVEAQGICRRCEVNVYNNTHTLPCHSNAFRGFLSCHGNSLPWSFCNGLHPACSAGAEAHASMDRIEAGNVINGDDLSSGMYLDSATKTLVVINNCENKIVREVVLADEQFDALKDIEFPWVSELKHSREIADFALASGKDQEYKEALRVIHTISGLSEAPLLAQR